MIDFQHTIDFMGKRMIAVIFSAILIVISLGSFIVNGMQLGLDFTGGTQVEVLYEESPDLEGIRTALGQAGYSNYEVVFFGSDLDVVIRIQDAQEQELLLEESSEAGNRVFQVLQENTDQNIQLLRSEFIGSQVGSELRDQGGLGMIVALIMIMIYISMRFQFKFAVGAVAALAHDVIIVLGFFSLMQFDFDLTVLAAVLAVIGYSLNDTIVVSDRIRENFRILRGVDATETINTSITQTFSRTLITSLTTLLVLLALLFVGGEMIQGFAMALTVGVVIGTYSSIYVAANVLLYMHISKEDLIPAQKEDAELDAIP
ncbi:MAG: protein translocase subunit SecF [Gammaproteobacteria bacterium]|nr:protein translocase subunit SecF [Gammaproteobacteria bacterium]MAY03113.1 protein translocase subunit SecF [Gammaproteobacteria bacterium]|tara:strand:- start:101379 stop:102326 length:948 start_codon:yes stop_codon:yes gene_type:complete